LRSIRMMASSSASTIRTGIVGFRFSGGVWCENAHRQNGRVADDGSHGFGEASTVD